MEMGENRPGKIITCVKFDEKFKKVNDKLVEDFPEHIIGCKLLKSEGKIVTVTSRNVLTIRKSSNLQIERTIQCDYFATSICSQILGESVADLKIYFGSVIGDLIDWKIDESPIWRKGHKGMIFSIVNDSTRIFTISDDRTVRMWSILDRNAGPICTVFGHTARPFSICVDESSKRIYTGGIDQTIFCWKYTADSIQIFKKTPISAGVIRKIEKNAEENELVVTAQDGNVLKISLEEENQSILLENVVNFARFRTENDFLAVLNAQNQFLVMENEKIQFLCNEMRHLAASDESCVVWNGKSLIFVYQEHFHRLKLSGSVISAICEKEKALVKTIDGFLTLYNFSDPESIRIETSIRPPNPSVIPSVFCVIDDRFLVIGTTHGELFHVAFDSELQKHRFSDIFGGKEVTCIRRIPGTLSFMTLGKTGHWATFQLVENDKNGGKLEILNCRQFSAASRMAWPSKFIEVDGELLVVGFYGTSLMIWNSATNLPVFEVYCGGGHREWHLTPSTPDHHTLWHFDFIRDGQLVRQNIDFHAKRHVEKAAHTSPIVSAAAGEQFLVTVSLDGHLCVSEGTSSSTPLLNIFVGENLLTTSILETPTQNFISTGGGKCKLSIFEFGTAQDLKRHTFRLRSVSRPDEGRIVATGIAEIGQNVFFVVCFSSGTIEVFSHGLETVFKTELDDSLGIGAKCHVAKDGLVTIGTSGGHFLEFRIGGNGELEELRDVKLADRSGVTALHGHHVGCDSGHVYRIHVDGHVAHVHSHLSTVVGIAIEDHDDKKMIIHSVSLDCVVVTSSADSDDVRKRRTQIDMPGGMVAIGGRLVVVGDGRCLVDY